MTYLKIHTLNVNNGDSIVLEHQNENGEMSYAVIDSNKTSMHERPPALDLLETLGAERLDFIVITHPHADHYTGMHDILERYKGNIGTAYTFPLPPPSDPRWKDLINKHLDYIKKQDDPEIRRGLKELLYIFKNLQENMQDDWEYLLGLDDLITTDGFKGIEFRVIQPPKKVKGPYFSEIMSDGAKGLLERDLNNLSSAILLKAYGNKIILGGDVTYENWLTNQRKMKTHTGNDNFSMNSNVVKLPHHGSEKDNKADVLNYLFGGEEEKIAIISANGQKHPSPQVIKSLKDNGIEPYCTNLMKSCGAKVEKFQALPSALTPKLSKTIRELSVDSSIVQPCQGDITITISPLNKIKVDRQYNHPCPFRKGLLSKLRP